MSQIEEETINLETKQLIDQLDNINNQHNEIICNIESKYQMMVKNSDDALKYVGDYIKITNHFDIMRIEDNKAIFMAYCDNKDIFKHIAFKFNKLCHPYIKVVKNEIYHNACIIIFERI